MQTHTNNGQGAGVSSPAKPSPAVPRIPLHFRTWRVAIPATDRHLLLGFATEPRFAEASQLDAAPAPVAEFPCPSAANAAIAALRQSGWRTALWPFEVVWAGATDARINQALHRVKQTAIESAYLELVLDGMSDEARALAGLERRQT